MTNGEEMKPWEQHSKVIIIPRFDYNAPSSLLSHSLSGFLITCTFKREKSATKEAMSILGKYLGSCTSSDSSGEVRALKRREINAENIGDGDQSGTSLLFETVETSETNSVLSLVKLTKSGLLLFTFSKDTSFDTVSLVSSVLRSLESEGSASPQWCHRILPIQATCSLNEKELGDTVSKLVCDFVSDKHYSLARPLKFAVGYNRRGYEETEPKKLPKGDSKTSSSSTLLDRNTCFSIVGSAVNGVVPHSVVDLKSPELSVLVELLPLSGVPNGSFVAGVSVLPQSLVTTKPRLCVKSLVSTAKPKA